MQSVCTHSSLQVEPSSTTATVTPAPRAPASHRPLTLWSPGEAPAPNLTRCHRRGNVGSQKPTGALPHAAQRLLHLPVSERLGHSVTPLEELFVGHIQEVGAG